ncbi:RNA polymerase sigma factor [Candidatus Clostridium stratigraminis]|uniref:RNA polymerase sigma factor n=1 Tax=Candidatus Clostridium stratigraminis TaxID=3381661 RepID=A0ABW8SZ92_9CLOT
MEAERNIIMKVDDEESIGKLCNSTWEAVYRFVYYKVQNQEEAEDITQETYIKAIRYIRNNRAKIDNTIGFLKTVSLNVMRDRWRKNKRQGTLINIDDINPKDAAIRDLTEDIGQQDAVQNALLKLNEDQRSVIDLRILKGYSVADTAKKMDKTEGNIRTLQFRALQNLSKLLKNDFK